MMITATNVLIGSLIPLAIYAVAVSVVLWSICKDLTVLNSKVSGLDTFVYDLKKRTEGLHSAVDTYHTIDRDRIAAIHVDIEALNNDIHLLEDMMAERIHNEEAFSDFVDKQLGTNKRNEISEGINDSKLDRHEHSIVELTEKIKKIEQARYNDRAMLLQEIDEVRKSKKGKKHERSHKKRK